jgi:hypothetical protein
MTPTQRATHALRERIAEIILDSPQTAGADLAADVGLSDQALRHHTRQLELAHRIHRVRPIGALGMAGGIWAPGAAPRDGGEQVAEPVHVTVRTWIAGPARMGMLEAFFFGMAGAGVAA